MRKSLPLLLLLTIFAAGCAHQQPTQPLPPLCPAPPKLPPLNRLAPSMLERSFLSELEAILFRSQSEATPYGLNSKPVTAPTKPPGLGLKP